LVGVVHSRQAKAGVRRGMAGSLRGSRGRGPCVRMRRRPECRRGGRKPGGREGDGHLSRRREPARRPFSRPIPPRPRPRSRAVGTRHASRDKEVPMISVALTMALIMPVLLTTTGIAHAAENRYGMATAPPYNATMVVLTEYSDDESYVITVARMGRLVVSESG